MSNKTVDLLKLATATATLSTLFSDEVENTLKNLHSEIDNLTNEEWDTVLNFFLDYKFEEKEFAKSWVKTLLEVRPEWVCSTVGIGNTNAYWQSARTTVLDFFKAKNLTEVAEQQRQNKDKMVQYGIHFCKSKFKDVELCFRGAKHLENADEQIWCNFTDDLKTAFEKVCPEWMDESHLEQGGYDLSGINLTIANPFFGEQHDSIEIDFDVVPTWVVEFVKEVQSLINYYDTYAAEHQDCEDEDYEDEDYED